MERVASFIYVFIYFYSPLLMLLRTISPVSSLTSDAGQLPESALICVFDEVCQGVLTVLGFGRVMI